jgi:fumarate hydratase subunit alpha/L(+)-tartrate dehydratase alpha subunit
MLPPDIKEGFAGLAARETDATAKQVLGTMITNIRVAEDTENLLCQDTGIPSITSRSAAASRWTGWS